MIAKHLKCLRYVKISKYFKLNKYIKDNLCNYRNRQKNIVELDEKKYFK